MDDNPDLRDIIAARLKECGKALQADWGAKEKDLFSKVDNYRRENDSLRRELWDLNQRIQRVAGQCGFRTLNALEDSNFLRQDPPNIVDITHGDVSFAQPLQAKMQQLAEQLNSPPFTAFDLFTAIKSDLLRFLKMREVEHSIVCEARDDLRGQVTKLEQQLSQVSQEVSELKKEKEAWVASEAERTSAKAQLDAVPPPLAHLQSQYDSLLASKRTISAKYLADIGRWKAFKEKLVKDGAFKPTVCDSCKKTLGGGRKAKSRLSKAWEDVGLSKGFGLEEGDHGNDADVEIDKAEAEAPAAPAAEVDTEIPAPEPSSVHASTEEQGAEKQGEDRTVQPPTAAEKETEHIIVHMSPKKRKTKRSHVPLPDRSGQLGRLQIEPTTPAADSTVRMVSSPQTTAKMLAPQRIRRNLPHTEPPTRSFETTDFSDIKVEESPTFLTRVLKGKEKQQEPEVGGESEEEGGREEAPSPTRPSRAQKKSNVLGKRKPSPTANQGADDGEVDQNHPAAGPSRIFPKKKNRQQLQEVTLNAMYEINRDQNQGLSFEFDEVVRNKAARKRMEAGDCLECREYYEAVGPLPPRLAAPLWRSPSPQSSSQPKEMPIRPPCRHHMVPEEEHAPAPAASPAKRSKAINQHKKEISRHRHYWAPPTTPPGFWNIGFPSTQEVEEINRQAKEMHEKKREWMEREANKPDGKYRKRA